MKWHIDGKPKPKKGDVRSVRRFAWLPVRCDAGSVVVWLERYCTVEEFVVDDSSYDPWAPYWRVNHRHSNQA